MWLLVAAALAGPAPDPLAHVPSTGAGAVVRRAFEHHGGFAPWAARKTVTFKKTTTRFRPDGSVEGTRVQRHFYVLQPALRARIEWEEGGQAIVLVNSGGQAWKTVGGRRVSAEADVNQARNTTFGSHYVFGMPFKLADPGVRLEAAPPVRLRAGGRADAVRVVYPPGVGDAGGLHDWTYYFEPGSGRLAANLLRYDASRYEYTEYADDTTADGFVYARKRVSYDATARGAKGRPRAEIVYDDVRFDQPLGDALFR